MAALIDLAVPGLGSGFDLIVKGLKKLYSKYSQLKEGKELCLNLHGRLQTFIHELSKIEIQTVQKEELLSRLKNLVKDYYNTVVEYANETNYIKRAVRVSKFIEAIKQYNERLDFLLKVIVVKHTADFVEWRVQYEQDTGAMMAQLTDINESQKVILRAIEHLPDDMILLLKRELKQTPDGKSHPLDGTLRKIINVTEQVSNKTYQTPPNWYISINECQLYKPAIDIKGQSEIFTGKWQGVQVAIKKFRLVGENPVFDKHYEIWRSLLHPHVAQLYGVGSDEDAPFMVYEFASKKSLDRHWGYLSQQKDIWQLLYQASLGLSYLHARNVVHGNLSSSKLLVTSQNQVKLFGFGASYVRQDNKSNSLKPRIRVEFSAPECIGVRADGCDDGVNHSPTFSSDVYSFGLTIIEAITRKNPFEGLPLDDILDIKRNNQLQKPEEMNKQGWDLVQQMCLCNPNERVSLATATEELCRLAS